MEADIDSAVDAEIMAGTGVCTIQPHTGGMCHLDAGMTGQGLRKLGTEDLDLAIKLKIFPVSAKTGEGIEAWAKWLYQEVAEWKGEN